MKPDLCGVYFPFWSYPLNRQIQTCGNGRLKLNDFKNLMCSLKMWQTAFKNHTKEKTGILKAERLRDALQEVGEWTAYFCPEMNIWQTLLVMGEGHMVMFCKLINFVLWFSHNILSHKHPTLINLWGGG